MDTASQRTVGVLTLGAVKAVVVDHRLIIEVEFRSIVRTKAELVTAQLADVKPVKSMANHSMRSVTPGKPSVNLVGGI